MNRHEAEELVVRDKCDGCPVFPGCKYANTFNGCDDFNKLVDETLEDEKKQNLQFLI